MSLLSHFWVTAGAGDVQPSCCDAVGDLQASGDGACMFNDNQVHDPGVERPSIQTATHACLQPERHLQRDPSRSCLPCAGVQGEAQTAKSASPPCDVHLQRNLKVRHELRHGTPGCCEWNTCLLEMMFIEKQGFLLDQIKKNTAFPKTCTSPKFYLPSLPFLHFHLKNNN